MHSDGARLLCLALPYIAPILREIVNFVHALRDHPHPKVRAIARNVLPPPQELTIDDEPATGAPSQSPKDDHR